jgi:hypothetical protein
MDPDSAIFVIDLQAANKKLCSLLFEGTFVHLQHFSKRKSPEAVTKQ